MYFELVRLVGQEHNSSSARIGQGTFGREIRWRRHWGLCAKTSWEMGKIRKGQGMEGQFRAAITVRRYPKKKWQ